MAFNRISNFERVKRSSLYTRSRGTPIIIALSGLRLTVRSRNLQRSEYDVVPSDFVCETARETVELLWYNKHNRSRVECDDNGKFRVGREPRKNNYRIPDSTIRQAGSCHAAKKFLLFYFSYKRTKKNALDFKAPRPIRICTVR